MELRVLGPDCLETLYPAYLEAFSDYVIPVRPSFEAFASMLERRGANWERSIGAFDGERLVGLQITALGAHGSANVPTAYDVFTGIVPSHRGRGLAGRMFEAAVEALRPGEARQFLLECIQTNEPALRAYAKQGFQRVRAFECLELDVEAARTADADPGAAAGGRRLEVCERELVALDDLASVRTWTPSWQNGDASLRRADTAPLVLSAEHDGSLVGYVACFRESGDVAQLFVRGATDFAPVARTLLSACAARTSPGVERLRLVNVPTDATRDLETYARVGARSFTRQYELIRPL